VSCITISILEKSLKNLFLFQDCDTSAKSDQSIWDTDSYFRGGDDDDYDRSISTMSPPQMNRPMFAFTTVQPETSVPAPPRPVAPTKPVDSSSEERIDIAEYRRPWYARLPLVGWMFRSSEVTEEHVTRITLNK
jgi:hypothetical protein